MAAASVTDVGVDEKIVDVAAEGQGSVGGGFADVASGLVRSEQRWAAEYYARGVDGGVSA